MPKKQQFHTQKERNSKTRDSMRYTQCEKRDGVLGKGVLGYMVPSGKERGCRRGRRIDATDPDVLEAKAVIARGINTINSLSIQLTPQLQDNTAATK